MTNREPKLLLAVLKELTANELKEFKWHLSQENCSFQHIPKCELEHADRQDTVDRMIQTYCSAAAVEITVKILKDINQNHLADKLSRDYSLPESSCNQGALSLVAPLTDLHSTPGLTMFPALTFRAEVRLWPMDGNKVRVEVIPESTTSLSLTPAGPSVTPAGPSVTPAGPSVTPAGPSVTPAGLSVTPAGPSVTPAGPSVTPAGLSMTPAGPSVTPAGPSMTPAGLSMTSSDMLTKLNECSKIRINMLGSGAVGKSCMVSTFLTNQFPSEYVPSFFDQYTKDIGDSGCFGSLEIRDMTGLSDYDNLRRKIHYETDVFLVCFSVVYPDSFEEVDRKWIPEINHYSPGTPYLVVGTQIDLRNDPCTLERLAKKKLKPINSETAKKRARQQNAFKYVECSALTQEGLKDVFDEAILAVLGNQQFKSKKCVVS